MVRRKRVLISGGSGLIGCELLKVLFQSCDVFELCRTQLRLQRELLCEFTDWSPAELGASITAAGGVDVIIHLAGQPTVWKSLKDPVLDAESNILQSVRLFEMAKLLRPHQVILFSSEAVYGDQESPSESSERKPVNPYGVSKLAAENYLQVLLPNSIKKLILIPSFVVGEKMSRNIVFDIVSEAVRSRSVSIPYSAESRFDFISVGEVAHAVESAIFSGLEGRHHLTGVDLSASDVVRVVRDLIGYEFQVTYGVRDRISCLQSEHLDVSKFNMRPLLHEFRKLIDQEMGRKNGY